MNTFKDASMTEVLLKIQWYFHDFNDSTISIEKTLKNLTDHPCECWNIVIRRVHSASEHWP